MSAQTLLYVTVAVNVVGFIVTGVLVAMKKNPKAVEAVIAKADEALQTGEKLFEGTPLAPFLNIGDEILKAADTGVHYAEQIFLNGQQVDRKSVATEYVANVLKEFGVDITPRIAAIVDGAVESVVNLLPSTKDQLAARASESKNA